jgi:PAS domain-containing protein
VSATSESAATRLVLRLHRLASLPPGSPRPPARHVVDLGAPARTAPDPTPSPLARWSAAVAAAHEACLMLDAGGRVVSVSVAAATVLGWGDVGVVGRPLLTVADIVDFDTGASDPDYAARVAPLAVLGGNGLMRSLLRVRRSDRTVVTLDTSSAPVHDVDGGVVGSVTFFSVLGS